ncbi:MAG: glucose-6-phosphate isomerase [Paracoccaceae bacterium]
MDIWGQLAAYRAAHEGRKIADLCGESGRFAAFSAASNGLVLDYAKTNLCIEGRALLLDLAVNTGVAAQRDAMFSGEKINETEGRAVLHTALRAPQSAQLVVDGQNIMPAIHATLGRMAAFAEGLESGTILASDGSQFSDVINIGIGGSDLGPAMAVRALSPYARRLRVHFVSNVDGADIADTLAGLDPARTLIIIASKTFTTIETMTNAATAKAWLGARKGHLAAVSTALDKTEAFGIPAERVFGFEDWVGGRYSLWGPIGLPIMLAIGPENFAAFLAGGHAMDRHFCTAAPAENLPILLGLVGVWHNNICGYATRAVLPYDQRLGRLPAYLQQLDMESNGKSVTMGGDAVPRATGPVVWGEPGTNGQHAFYQLIHQGTAVVPCEFLIAAEGHEPDLLHQHDLLRANCLAQSRALMLGRDMDAARALMAAKGLSGAERERQAAHRVFPGNRPSVTLAYRKLTPFVLGQIIALYEHRVFVEATIWGINAFDQWGVELGKELAVALLPHVTGDAAGGLDASTAGLLRVLK